MPQSVTAADDYPNRKESGVWVSFQVPSLLRSIKCWAIVYAVKLIDEVGRNLE